MGQRDWQRHQLRCVVARVSEHQPLIAGTLPIELIDAFSVATLVPLVDALRDVGRLGTDRHRYAARRTVETLLRRVVADSEDHLADDRWDIGPRLGRHLTGDVHLARRDERLDCYPAFRVVLEQRVEDAVTDLVGDLVRVAFGDGLGREQATGHGAPSVDSGGHER